MFSLHTVLLSIVLFWMSLLGTPNSELARADVDAAVSQLPIFDSDPLLLRELAWLVAIQFRESSFDNRAVGDHGGSFCAMQIHRSIGGSRALTENVDACVTHGLFLLRESTFVDRQHPLAYYARGPRFRSLEAQHISDDRSRIVDRLLASTSP
jgi:hypothetical protein